MATSSPTSKRVRLLAAAALTGAALCSSGCVVGLLYHDVTTPLTVDMNRTPNLAAAKTAESAHQRASEPFTGLNIRVEVSSYAIGDAAKRGDISEIHYADVRQQSVLLGLWQQKTVIVKGRSVAEQ